MAATYFFDFTEDEITAYAQRIGCCVGHLGQQKSDAEKAGNYNLVAKITQEILAIENVVNALCCYTGGSETNILTPYQLQKLIESAHKICGCGCNDASLQTDATPIT